ncbi:MAG: SDR family NAD(P)-dependent oxidoreductase [Clostridium neonatale]
MRIAIVTGASSGLGLEFIKTLINKYKDLQEIWVIARRKERLVQIADKYKDVNIRPVSIDLGKDKSYTELEQILQKEKPEIQILINNAGYERIGYFKDMDMSDIISIINVNIKGITAINNFVYLI